METCQCKGVRLFTEIVDLTNDVVASPVDFMPVIHQKARILAQATYDHLMDEAYKPENKVMHGEVNHLLEKVRTAIGGESGIHAMETVRDAIHKSMALQQLLVCGGPYDIPENRTEAAKTIGKACNIIAETDDDVHPILQELSKKLGCGKSKLLFKETFL